MTATFSAFHHVTLSVTDLAASERFYCDVLGFTRLRATAATPGAHVIAFRDPDNIQLEFFVVPPAA